MWIENIPTHTRLMGISAQAVIGLQPAPNFLLAGKVTEQRRQCGRCGFTQINLQRSLV